MNIIIIGSRGFIGSELATLLAESGYRIFLPFRASSTNELKSDKDNIVSYSYDGTAGDLFAKCPQSPDLVINCAGELRNSSRFLEANFNFPKEVHRCCSSRQIKLIDFSSLGIFSGYQSGVINVGTKPVAIGEYELSKKMYFDYVMEKGLCKEWHMVLLPSAVIGGTKGFGWKHNLILFLGRLGIDFVGLEGKSVGLHFCHIDDIKKVVTNAAQSFSGGTIILNESIVPYDLNKTGFRLAISLQTMSTIYKKIRSSKMYRTLTDTRVFESDSIQLTACRDILKLNSTSRSLENEKVRTEQ